LIEASKDPLVTININGQITGMNEATVKNYRLGTRKVTRLDFFTLFYQPQKMAREVYQEVFAKGSVADSLTLRHKDGKLTDVYLMDQNIKMKRKCAWCSCRS
jgi:hypothetical protein